jgi:hypothetical protein
VRTNGKPSHPERLSGGNINPGYACFPATSRFTGHINNNSFGPEQGTDKGQKKYCFLHMVATFFNWSAFLWNFSNEMLFILSPESL